MRIGTGLQNKLLEAMSMKIPSITTPLANDALKAKHGEQILIGETPQQLANAIILLLENETDYNKIAKNGHNFVKDNYSWQEATEMLNQLIHST